NVDPGVDTLIPGSSLIRRQVASRRLRSTSSICPTGVCGPRRAAIPAHCTQWLVQDSSVVFIVELASATAVGATAQPRRDPVIAYFFENVERMTVRSSIPGSAAMDCERPL